MPPNTATPSALITPASNATPNALETPVATPNSAIPGPKVVLFGADPTTVKPGGGVTLVWDVEGATSVEVAGFPGQFKPTKGLLTVNPPYDTTYVLIAKNAEGGVTVASVTIDVEGSAVFVPFVIK
jgi:hypothetical protein